MVTLASLFWVWDNRGMKHLTDLLALAVALDALTLPAESELTDAELVEAQQVFARIRRAADVGLAHCAGIVAHRSRPELGYDGLAQRTGARTPEQFVQQVTGVSRREAGTLVRVGELMDAATAVPGALPVSQRGSVRAQCCHHLAHGLERAPRM